MTSVLKTKAIDLNEQNEKSRDKRKQLNLLNQPTHEVLQIEQQLKYDQNDKNKLNLNMSLSIAETTNSHDVIRNLNYVQINQINISKKYGRVKDVTPTPNLFNFTLGDNSSNMLQSNVDNINNNLDMTIKNDNLLKYENEDSNATIIMKNKSDSGKLLKAKVFEFKKKMD